VDRAVVEVERIVARGITSAHALVGGAPLIGREAAAGAKRDLLRGEAVALPLMLGFLLLVFGGLLAASVPVLVAAASVGGTLLLLWPIANARAVSPYTVNVVTMFGLALGVDYGLLLLSRFREERHGGVDVQTAVTRTMATAGRTVTFSGLTIIAAMLGLPAFGDPLLTSLAIGGAVVVAVSVLAARTLVPALLLVGGRRVRDRKPPPDDGRLARLAGVVVRRPWTVAIGVTALLVLSAAPVLHADVVLPDHRVLPTSSPSRQVAEVLAEDYRGRYDPSVTVVVRAPAVASAWRATLAGLPGVTGVEQRAGYGPDLQVIDVHVSGSGQDKTAQNLVRAIRADARERGLPVQLTGQAAILVDYRHHVGQRLAPAIALVVAATLLLLFLMTGSVVVPIKAVLMALLSLTATVGVLVWGFQDGHLVDAPTGGLSAEVPLVIFVFAFGLSLDYEVFLLARVREVWLQTGDSSRSVTVALQRTGGVITSAALLVVIVFLGFATGDILVVREVGIGLATAVIVDATVVRCLLVPAVMALLGRRNWWAPAPLARLHRRLGARAQP
jgi:RND superfamily putative drug exporter